MALYRKIILIVWNLLDAKVADFVETYLRSGAANFSTRSLT